MNKIDFTIPNTKMKPKRIKHLLKLSNTIGYNFEHLDLLNIAMTHSSYANENKDYNGKDNERLEFLGDTVINLVTSNILFIKYQNKPEGELTKKRSVIVSEPTLAYAARSIGLGEYLRLGKGEEISGGRDRDSLLADAFEALWGAVYIDAGFDITFKLLVDNFLEKAAKATKSGTLFCDYKTKLQEYCQKKSNQKVSYIMISEDGPDHDKIFTMAVFIGEKCLGEGSGKSKKEAEQMAAKSVLQKVDIC